MYYRDYSLARRKLACFRILISRESRETEQKEFSHERKALSRDGKNIINTQSKTARIRFLFMRELA